MFSKEAFGNRLLELRSNKNVSQQSLADCLGIGRTAVSMMESGKRVPSIEIAYSLAAYFGVSLGYLVGQSDDPWKRAQAVKH
ncbi:MAG: helix-turn-helix domain-containing protein [Firmicutes bacterium]|nr:helix-turn-helix domain-containing protein [Bacillota bacterium]